MGYFNNLNQIIINRPKYKVWNEEQEEIDEKRQVLYKTVATSQDQLDMAKHKGITITNAINLLDEITEDKTKDVENTVSTGFELGATLLAFAGLATMDNPKHSKINKTLTALLLALPIAQIPISNYLEKKTSKIARYLARENELKDPRNFVVYTEDQIFQAKQLAKKIPDEDKTKHNQLDYQIKSVNSILNNRKNYKNWSITQKKIEKETFEEATKTNIPKEELEKIRVDKEVLTRITRKIAISGDDYASNVEDGVGAISNASFIPAGFIAIGTNRLIRNLQKQGKLNSKYISPGKLSSSITILSGLILPLCINFWGNNLKKNATRVGRFKAEQELLKDPHNFISYSNNQIKNTEKTQYSEPKKQNGVIKESLLGLKFFLFNFKKDLKEYNQFQISKGKNNNKIREALKMVTISKQQAKDGKELQEKAFKIFEKMDGTSEKYSNNVGLLTQLLNPTIPFIFVGMAIVGIMLMKQTNQLGKYASKQLDKLINHKEKINTIKMPAFINQPIKNIKKMINDFNNEFLEIIKKKSPKGTIPKDATKLNEALKKIELSEVVDKLFDSKVIRKPLLIFGPVIIGTYFTVAYIIQGLFTELEKDASRIGFMDAIKQLDDPVQFINKDKVSYYKTNPFKKD